MMLLLALIPPDRATRIKKVHRATRRRRIRREKVPLVSTYKHKTGN